MVSKFDPGKPAISDAEAVEKAEGSPSSRGLRLSTCIEEHLYEHAFARAFSEALDKVPPSMNPAEVSRAIDRVSDDLTRRMLYTRTPVHFGTVDRIRVLFGWRVFVDVATPCFARRADIDHGGDWVDFFPSESDVEVRTPDWWHRVRWAGRRILAFMLRKQLASECDSDVAETP